MNELPGRELGQYHLIEQIGQGGMATVFKARQPGLDRIVALKLLSPQQAQLPGFRERFLREAQAIARLDHPHILPVYDFGQQDGFSYIAMRYIAGAHTLKEVMLQPLPLSRIAGLIGQVAAALDAAHQQGLVHRDVKPANVLMDGDWAYLADFGLAKLLAAPTDLTASGASVGTPAYM